MDARFSFVRPRHVLRVSDAISCVRENPEQSYVMQVIKILNGIDNDIILIYNLLYEELLKNYSRC